MHANSVCGAIEITHHTIINLFEPGTDIQFVLLPLLRSFHTILGNDSLKELSAVIHAKESYMTVNKNIKIKLKQQVSESIHNVSQCDKCCVTCRKNNNNNLIA